jgi:cellulose synthase/poly-beta-1,6-N-acetylglucosamine synthase-like glycosyltransferase
MRRLIRTKTLRNFLSVLNILKHCLNGRRWRNRYIESKAAFNLYLVISLVFYVFCLVCNLISAVGLLIFVWWFLLYYLFDSTSQALVAFGFPFLFPTI